VHPERSGFDYECGAFRAGFILNEFKQIGLIGCLILNVALALTIHNSWLLLLRDAIVRMCNF